MITLTSCGKIRTKIVTLSDFYWVCSIYQYYGLRCMIVTCLSLSLSVLASARLSSGLRYLLALNLLSSAPVCAAVKRTCPPFRRPPRPHHGLQQPGGTEDIEDLFIFMFSNSRGFRMET